MHTKLYQNRPFSAKNINVRKQWLGMGLGWLKGGAAMHDCTICQYIVLLTPKVKGVGVGFGGGLVWGARSYCMLGG